MSQHDNKEFNRDFMYTLPAKVMFHPDITLLQLRIYAIIRSFMDTTGVAFCSNNWIAKTCGVKRNAVIVGINTLVKMGFIRRRFDGEDQRYLEVVLSPLVLTDDRAPSIPKDTPPRIPKDTPPSIPKDTQLDQSTILSKTTTTKASSSDLSEKIETQILNQKLDSDPRSDAAFLEHAKHHIQNNSDKKLSQYQRVRGLLTILKNIKPSGEHFCSKGFIDSETRKLKIEREKARELAFQKSQDEQYAKRMAVYEATQNKA